MSISFDFDKSGFNRALVQATNEALAEKVLELQAAFDSLILLLNAIEPLPSTVEATEIARKSSFYEVFEAGPEVLMEYLQLDNRGKYQSIRLTHDQITSI